MQGTSVTRSSSNFDVSNFVLISETLLRLLLKKIHYFTTDKLH